MKCKCLKKVIENLEAKSPKSPAQQAELLTTIVMLKQYLPKETK